MTPRWPAVRLGEVLLQRKEFFVIDDLETYRRPRVQLHAQGIVLRDQILGAVIKTKSQQVCRAGEFLVAEIDAKVGGFGIVPQSLDGSIVSSHYFLFTIDEAKLERQFLAYFIRTAAFRRQIEAQGSTNYAAIRPRDVLAYEIPLPSPQDQRRMVARIQQIEAITSTIESVQSLASQETEQLPRAILAADKSAVPTPTRRFLTLRRPDVTVRPSDTYRFAGVFSFGRGVFPGVRRSGLEFSYTRLTRLRAGDFVYPKLMAWEGAFGVVPRDCDGLVVSTEFPVFEIDRSVVHPQVVATHFRDPAVWPKVAGHSTGTNVRRRRLHPQQLLEYPMPLPDQATQERLVAVSSQLALIQSLHEQRAKELDALLPSVLDRVFKGEL